MSEEVMSVCRSTCALSGDERTGGVLKMTPIELVSEGAGSGSENVSEFRPGELVEVRSKAEILGTLDRNGRLEELPFMPEMLQYCGKRFRVYKRAHKTCDFVTNTGSRRLERTVHLEDIRCDGAAHGGCMAACLIFWKEAWLRRTSDTSQVSPVDRGCSEDQLRSAAQAAASADGEPAYVCQATQLPKFTEPLSPWDVRQYIEDYRSGNVRSLAAMAPRFIYRAYDNLINLGIGWGPVLRWFYDRFQALRGGLPHPGRAGAIPAGGKTPAAVLNLQPGELVRVKDQRAILETVDTNCRNRGMSFSAEMVPYCGGTYRVRSIVNRLIDERTGRMLTMKNSCVILEGVICQARYNEKMIFCPRATFPYWREIWLERVTSSSSQPSTA
jgi:hypothetical protein